MKRSLPASLAAIGLLASACSVQGSTATFDPSGKWSMALLVTAGTGDGAGKVDSARLFTTTIQQVAGGGNAYNVLMNEAGGGVHLLSASVEGDQLRLAGSLPWSSGSQTGEANVLSSAVTIRDSILFGTVAVALAAGASGTETWFFSAYDPATQGNPISIEQLGWWRLDQVVVYAEGDFTPTWGDSSEAILFVGPHEIFKFVVAWWREDDIWGGVAQAQGNGLSLDGWSRMHDEAGMTWQETIMSFKVEVSGNQLAQQQIALRTVGDHAGTQVMEYTGSRAPSGTVPGTPVTIWAERFESWEPAVDE